MYMINMNSNLNELYVKLHIKYLLLYIFLYIYIYSIVNRHKNYLPYLYRFYLAYNYFLQ